MYDCLIIGGGPAGMTAALYLARKRMKILLLTSDYGGQMAKAASVENYPGLERLTGVELTAKLQKHLEEYNVESKTVEVYEIVKKNVGFEVKTKDQNFQSKSIIVCSGKAHRKLNVSGEEDLIGKGISYCATCDAPLFKDKIVVVVGGGNSALDAALELEKYAQKVYIVSLNNALQADAILKERFEKSEKGEIIYNARTTEIVGEQKVKALKYEDQNSKKIKEIVCEGVFVEIGWTPSTDFVKSLVKLNILKEIEVDKTGATSVVGIFAAGDVTNTPFKQIIIAAGEGAKAALSAWKYLITQKN